MFIWKGQPNYADKSLYSLVFVINVTNLPFHMFTKNVLTVYHVPGIQEILRKLIQAFDLEEFIIQ